MLTGVVAGVAATALFAADVSVSNDDSLLLGNGETIVPNTLTVGDTLPDIGVDPIFWIDASDTNGWEFASGKPKKIPSKVGTRYLKNYKEDGDSVIFSTYPYGAGFVADGLNGRPCLDFGAMNSGNGYMFNPVSSGDSTVNALEGIQTVIAVYGSQNGGGHFVFGGGSGSATSGAKTNGNAWKRGFDNAYGDPRYNQMATLFAGEAIAPLFNAVAYHDGVRTDASRLGMSGGWEVISLVTGGETGANADGVGINNITRDNNGYNQRTGGGMCIAEVLAYDVKLTDAQRLAVEGYLRKKWFGLETVGVNGLAAVGRVRTFSSAANDGHGVTAGATVAAGETLRITELLGGRGDRPSFTKSGAGTLELGTAGGYHGAFRLAGGTLAFRRMVESDALPQADSVYLHLDTGVENCFETEVRDDVEYVKRWENLAAARHSSNNGTPFFTAQKDESRQPTLVYDSDLKANVVDFGTYKSGGAYLNISTETSDYANNTVSHLGTMFAIADLEEKGVFFGADNDSGAYARGTYSLWSRKWPASVNGVQVSATGEAEDSAGFCLIGTQMSGWGVCGRVGAYNTGTTAGGLRLAELVLYDHVLSPEDYAKAEAFLMRKWFGRDRPGFDTKYDVDRLEVIGSSVIDVPAGVTVKVRSLVCKATLEKRGAGTLVVDATSNVEESGISANLQVRGGAFRFVETDDVVTDASKPAGDTYLHLDAADARAFRYTDAGKVARWRETGSVYENVLDCSSGASGAATRMADGLGTGYPAVDFIEELGYYSPYGVFRRPLDAIRTIYAVVGNLDKGGCFLGLKARSDSNWLDDRNLGEFDRNGAKTKFMNQNDNYTQISGAKLYIDGVNVYRHADVTGDKCLIEIHAAGGCHASAIARNAIGNLTGGIRIGEMLAYDRVHTDRERAATRNYLLKKWFGKSGADLDELPEKPAEDTDFNPSYETYQLDEDASYTIDNDWTIGRLKGAGDFVKSGSGSVSVRDLSGYTGTFVIEKGTLGLTGTPCSGLPEYLPQTDHVLFHADAENGPVVITNATTGEMTCQIWNSANGNGWCAVTTNSYPTRPWVFDPARVDDKSLNGKRTIRFRNWNSAGRLCGMDFVNPQGETAQIGGIRSVLWVIGSQEGGGALLGGGASSDAGNGYSSFYRAKYNDYTGCILHGNAQTEVKDSCWRVNGTMKDWSITKLSGGWDTVSMVYKEKNVETPTSADGFAYNSSVGLRVGSSGTGGTGYANTGFQRLAEVVIYDAILSDEERIAGEHYLNRKWGLNGFAREQDSPTNLAGVVVASGATLDLGDTNQYVRVISGAGTVRNGTLSAGILIADAAAGTALTVEDGAFALVEGQVVDIRNFGSLADGVQDIPILTVTDMSGVENLGSVKFISSDGSWNADKARIRLRFRNGVLSAHVCGGLLMIVR